MCVLERGSHDTDEKKKYSVELVVESWSREKEPEGEVIHLAAVGTHRWTKMSQFCSSIFSVATGVLAIINIWHIWEADFLMKTELNQKVESFFWWFRSLD